VEYGLYLHLPYCRSLCPYCAFAKAPLHHAEPARLLRALANEWVMARRADGLWERPRTVFFGGGTPTALEPDALRDLLRWLRDSFDLSRVREWTVEANPEGITDAKLEVLREGGADRLSLGIQSLEPGVLRVLGRIHTPERALDAIASARRAEFRNISVDLMAAVPGETPDGFRRGVETLVHLEIPHLSVYSLQIEAGTPMAAKAARGTLTPMVEDAAAERYEELARLLADAGYAHYEVANWALPGFASRHNQGYWTRRPYLGLGPGAHSFDGKDRWRNEADVTRYFERVETGALPREARAALSERECAAERIMLGLRRARGLKQRSLERLAGTPVGTWSSWAARGGALRLDPPGRIRPTERGLLVANEIASDLLARMEDAPATA